MANLGTAYVTIMPSAKGISGSISKAISGESTAAGQTAGTNIVGALKKVIVGAGIGAVIKKSLDFGADLQQSFGGLETIYGEAAASMKELSYEAAQAGISANSYAEQAVSFGASLRQAYGGDMVAAAKAANTAILDMADNSAKMGTDISSIQAAYQGFAKQNYTMLDNLKLGYGGTKTEMERLLADAEKLSGVHYDIENLGDVYAAIHVIQEDLNLTGVAADEAKTTFSGSMQAMKAAAENLMASITLGQDIGPAFQTLAETAKNFLMNNLLPMVGNILKGLPDIVMGALRMAFTELPGLASMLKEFIDNITKGLSEGEGEITSAFTEIGNGIFDALAAIDWIGLGESIFNLIITGAKTFASSAFDSIKNIGETAANYIREIDWGQLAQDLIEMLRTGWETHSGLFLEGFQTLFQTAWDIVSSIDWIALGKAIIEFIVQAVIIYAETWWNTMKTIGQTAWDTVKDVDWLALGQTVIDTIVTGISNFGRTVWETLKSVGQKAWEWFKNIDWVGLGKQVLTTILTGILIVAGSLYLGVKNVATSAWDTFKNTDWIGLGRQVISTITTGLRNAGTTLWNGLKSIAQTAWTYVTTVDWVSLGKNIVNGIISGIKNMGSALINGLVECAKNAWTAAKQYLGISSPSKLFRDTVGKWIPLGIAEGIEDEEKSVQDALKDIARASVGTIDTSFAYDATKSGSVAPSINAGDNVTVNVYPSQGMDEKALANMVVRRMTLDQRQRNVARGLA